MQDQLQAMKSYASALERQNQAKSIENATIYREFQQLEKSLEQMDQYYYSNRQLRKEISYLKQQIQSNSNLLPTVTSDIQQFEEFNVTIRTYQNIINDRNNSISQLRQVIDDLQAEGKIMREENQSYKRTLFQEKQMNHRLTELCKQRQGEVQWLKSRLRESQVEELEANLQNLAENYEKVEMVVLQKDQRIKQMEEYIGQLQEQCQIMNQKYHSKGDYIKKLEFEIVSLKNRQNLREMSEDKLSMLTQSISKIDLIKQNNRMTEQVNQLQKQNKMANGLTHSYSQGAEKQRVSPSKLQMRIQTLKMENQSLLKGFVI